MDAIGADDEINEKLIATTPLHLTGEQADQHEIPVPNCLTEDAAAHSPVAKVSKLRTIDSTSATNALVLGANLSEITALKLLNQNSITIKHKSTSTPNSNGQCVKALTVSGGAVAVKNSARNDSIADGQLTSGVISILPVNTAAAAAAAAAATAAATTAAAPATARPSGSQRSQTSLISKKEHRRSASSLVVQRDALKKPQGLVTSAAACVVGRRDILQNSGITVRKLKSSKLSNSQSQSLNKQTLIDPNKVQSVTVWRKGATKPMSICEVVKSDMVDIQTESNTLPKLQTPFTERNLVYELGKLQDSHNRNNNNNTKSSNKNNMLAAGCHDGVRKNYKICRPVHKKVHAQNGTSGKSTAASMNGRKFIPETIDTLEDTLSQSNDTVNHRNPMKNDKADGSCAAQLASSTATTTSVSLSALSTLLITPQATKCADEPKVCDVLGDQVGVDEKDTILKLPTTPEKFDTITKFDLYKSPRTDKRTKSLSSPSVRSTCSGADRRNSSASDGKISIITLPSGVDISSDDLSDAFEFDVVADESKVDKVMESSSSLISESKYQINEIKIEETNDDEPIHIKVNETSDDSNEVVVIEVKKSCSPPVDEQMMPSVDEMIMPNLPATIKMEVVDADEETPKDPLAVEETTANLLLCKEKLASVSPTTPPSRRKPASLELPKTNVQTLLRNSTKQSDLVLNVESYSSVLDMLSIFNMLNWKERIGSTLGTKLKFHLNEFNLIQLHENFPARMKLNTAYEKPIYERETIPDSCEDASIPLYYCRRCNCHGPAVEFLAPEFCSLKCLKRDTRKLKNATLSHQSKKRPRKDPISKTLYESNENKRIFEWAAYLAAVRDGEPAPVDLFLNPFPTGPNNFKIGMKVEAIDPENCSLFCVCTIVDVQGYRLKLNFDGYSSMYDFWVNADSMDIFPPGWCAKTGRTLQPPREMSFDRFHWPDYLANCKAVAAQRQLFTHLNVVTLPWRNPFKVGMHLEAEDLNDTGKLCVATVADVLNDRIRIHFDGWDECYDYWVDTNSPYIHPCGWHEGRQQLIVPPDYENSAFNWVTYIQQKGVGEAAAPDLFVTRDPLDFKPNMKLEVVDPRNPLLIRPASVIARNRHRVKVHLDCWPSEYCFWLEDDSPDLHPIGWCDSTGHHLEPPPGYFRSTSLKSACTIFGCRGLGNAKSFSSKTHSSNDDCPYAPANWRHQMSKPKRVENENIVRLSASVKIEKTESEIETEPGRSASTHLTPILLSEHQRLEFLQKNEEVKLPTLKHNKWPHPQYIPPSGKMALISFADETNILSGEPRLNGHQQAIDSSIQVSKNFLNDYGPRLIQNYTLWQKNFDFDVKKIKRCPMQWSIVETCSYIENAIGNKQIAKKFQAEEIDGPAFLMLQQSDITDTLGIRLGPAVKLYSHILQLRTMVACNLKSYLNG